MSDKITITTEKDGKIIVFEGSGTLTLIERVGGWVDTRPTSLSREVRGVEVEWDGDYTIREANRERDTLEELEAARKKLADLRKESDRLERVLRDPLLLRGLEVAWEAAEVPTDENPIRKGDVVIEKITAGAYAVMSPPPTCGLAGREFRILSRAPRQPWEDLADALLSESVVFDSEDASIAARALHSAGVRVTVGDGDE